MKLYSNISVIFIFFCYLCFAVTIINGLERKPYIVYMGELPENSISLADLHHNLLLEVIGNEDIARESKIHSYGRSFNALAARLLPHEAKILSQNENVVSVFPSQTRQLRTTRSWDFIGFPLEVTRNVGGESDIIVGLLDTGIYISSKSFNDSGFGPPPPKWKGKCMKGSNFTGCNNKVIGAQYFNLAGEAPEDELSPADFMGHGTHTSSTAAGIVVPKTSYHELDQGTARGGVPSARIASYKVCWFGCPDPDILAGFDAAIADGVDILSISLGGESIDYFNDSIAIGAFHAMKKGILVSCAGGNAGRPSSIENVAPWIMTVAASTIDRDYQTVVELDDGRSFYGYYTIDRIPMKQMYPLLNGALARKDDSHLPSSINISACDPEGLDANKVKGNILFCRGNEDQDYVIKRLGGVGTIMSADPDISWKVPHTTGSPATVVTVDDGNQIDSYINSTRDAKAKIHKTIVTYDETAPLVAPFSSRGPQKISLNILKPDIIAPGVSILAAYSKLASLPEDPDDNAQYQFLSGTSMSTPHAAGAAAYVKSFHPNWSPAAIKSAIMTTANPFKTEVEDAELAYGSGQINPTKALHPGLIYDINEDSYINFLCKQGYSSKNIRKITGKKVNCSSLIETREGTDGLNYPSMHTQLITKEISAAFYRTVTYVGEGESMFKANISSPKDLSITVSPNTLAFSKPYQQKSFNVTLNGTFNETQSLSALLVWSDDKHIVRSPIHVYRLR